MGYPNLYSPWPLRSKVARNRLVVPAMATHFAELDGSVSEALRDYLEERARGGFGIVTTENIGIHPAGKMMDRMLMADDDRYLPGLAGLAQAIKRHGALAIGQINHAGRQTRSSVTGYQPVAPSAIACPVMKEVPHELTVAEIAVLQDAYAEAALRLQRAGFDGCEVHAAHGYLAASFLSAYSNRRTDAFGGSVENRLRFLTGIIERIQARADKDFLVFVRTSVEEFVPEGIDTQQTILIARHLAKLGVDLLSLSVGVYESYTRLTMLSGEPENPWLDYAARVRAAAAPLPIVGVGRIRRPEAAEAAIAAGQVDFVAIGRGAISNPDFARAFEHSSEPGVVACMSCNICLGRAADPAMTCPVNPFVGRERLLRSLDADARSIDILGGGFAALTAAWIASKRGASVRVVAAEGELAGMQAWRGRVPGQGEYLGTCEALVQRARDQGVRFVSPEAYTPTAAQVWRVKRWEPVGGPPAMPRAAATSYQVLRGRTGSLPRQVLVAGDDLSSVDAALLLAEQGHEVTLRSPARDIATDAHPGYRSINRALLASRGAHIEVRIAKESLFEGYPPGAVVVGRVDAMETADPQAWQSDFHGGRAEIVDAYEPGELTRAVYGAVELALARGA